MESCFDIVDYNFYNTLDLNTCLGLQDNSASNNEEQGLDINTQTLLDEMEVQGGISLSDLLENIENMPRIYTSVIDDKSNIHVQPPLSCSSVSAENNKINIAWFAAPLLQKDLEKKKRNLPFLKYLSEQFWACTFWRLGEISEPTTSYYFEPGFPIPEDISLFSNLNVMDYWLQSYICEIRRRGGKPYPPNSFTQITAAIQRYLRNDKDMHVNLFSKGDMTFPGFRRALDSRRRELTNQGISIEKKQAEPVTPTDERKMWETGVFSMVSATGLSNLVFYNNGKVFGYRDGEEHIGLKADQFSFGFDEINQRQFIKFTPRIRKMLKVDLNKVKRSQV